LKPEGGMIRMSLEKLVLLDRQVLHVPGQFCEESPKARRGERSEWAHR
jgi:hypothetical protein